ncbi:hypothetical protein HYW83_02425 [Candidatus Peregrinibacteria bacterium]|nr:hypothetical protein [Candidatus Peregrinibacteria bacterium]
MKHSLVLALALNACVPVAQIQRHEGIEMTHPFSKMAGQLEDIRDAIQVNCGLLNRQFSLIAVLQGKESGNFFMTELSVQQKACAQKVVQTMQAKNNCEIFTEEKGDRLVVKGICK